MILVDSSVWIDFFRDASNPHIDRLAKILNSEDELVMVGDLMLMEVLQGAGDDLRVHKITRRFSAVPKLTISNPRLAVQAAANYRYLRARGITIRKTIHTLIATRCIVDDYPLLYSDRDFDPFVEHLGLRSAMA